MKCAHVYLVRITVVLDLEDAKWWYCWSSKGNISSSASIPEPGSTKIHEDWQSILQR